MTTETAMNDQLDRKNKMIENLKKELELSQKVIEFVDHLRTCETRKMKQCTCGLSDRILTLKKHRKWRIMG